MVEADEASAVAEVVVEAEEAKEGPETVVVEEVGKIRVKIRAKVRTKVKVRVREPNTGSFSKQVLFIFIVSHSCLESFDKSLPI